MDFLLALRFLSILPVPGRVEATDRRLGRSTAWYPLVGVLLGTLLFGCAYLCTRLWSVLPAAFLCLAVWTLFTRGLHLDGLADTFDGLGGGANPDSRLAIMKDSRVGVFGVVALIIVLIGKFALLSELIGVYRIRGLILIPVLGRWAMLLLIFTFPAASKSGLGHGVKRHCRLPQFILGTVVAVACAWLLLGLWGLVALAVVAGIGAAFGLLFVTKLGGCTGDSYGAVCEISEVVSLAAVAILIHLRMPSWSFPYLPT
ncbi:MAG: adenosylcobinamide-GDP ribazoletransferase [Spirochaetaceae bacterium]|nr:MAG: adenosylcobinamide-GDP ribazoletransferase [Spirochaetaceae bacterium]